MLYKPSRCTAKPPETYEHHIAEEKLDGSRYVLYLGYCPYGRRSGNTLLSRRESGDGMFVDKTDNIPHITHVSYPFSDTVLDGEIMASTFTLTNSIMNSLPEAAILKQKEHGLVNYHVFDIMRYKGEDVTNKPLSERRTLLEYVISKMNNPNIRLIPQVNNPISLFNRVVNGGGEGVIIKDVRAPYGVGWSKLKKSYDISTVVMGSKPGVGKYKNMIGSLEIGVYKDNVLIPVGYISGFTDEERIDITNHFDKYLGRVVDVYAQEIGSKGRLRHPTFHRFRDDLLQTSCTYDKMLEDMKVTCERC